ncbi:methionine--tRNA ligase [Treponema sp.]
MISYNALHTEIYTWFNIAFDKFGRTSSPLQTKIVQDIFKKLDAAGYIVERTIEQLHCKRCDRFLADRYVKGLCPHCGSPDARGDQCEACGKLLDPTELKDASCSSCGEKPSLESRHLYIDLPKIKDRLEAWIDEASVKGFWSNNAIQMTQAWIRDGLRERAITRDLKWGIPVPKEGYEGKVFYVWFDAPIGYISIAASLADERGEDWKAFLDSWWKNPDEVDLFQFIGKDNIPFHTVIFPSSLIGSGDAWTLLHHMSSTEFLNYEAGKFSKSKGIGVFGTDAMETGISADTWRFYIFYNRPEKSDALFTWKDFQEKVNGELIGNLGNLVNRTLSFITRYYEGVIPDGASDAQFWAHINKAEQDIAEKLDRAELRDAFRAIFELSDFGNKAFQDGEPWKLRKENPEKAAALLRDLCYLLRDLAILVHPYLPASAERITAFFGQKIGKDALSWKDLGKPEGLQKVLFSEVLFTKLEDELVDSLRGRYSGSQKERAERDVQPDSTPTSATNEAPAAMARAQNTAPFATVEPQAAQVQAEIILDPAERFASLLDLRVAEIVKIERHPKADKLYIETLEIAGEERVIVSGLVPFYTEEELLGKRIIVAYNLKPAKLRGTESRGMLLAASDKSVPGSEIVEVLDAQTVPTGTRVAIEGLKLAESPGEIDIDTFFSVPIVTKDGKVSVAGKLLSVAGMPLSTVKVSNGEVG